MTLQGLGETQQVRVERSGGEEKEKIQQIIWGLGALRVLPDWYGQVTFWVGETGGPLFWSGPDCRPSECLTA